MFCLRFDAVNKWQKQFKTRLQKNVYWVQDGAGASPPLA